MREFHQIYTMRNNVNNEINIMLTGSLLCQSILMKEKHLKDQNVDYDFNSSFNKIKRVLENSDVAIGALDIGKSDIPLDYYRSLKNNGFNLCILNSRKSNCKEIVSVQLFQPISAQLNQPF